MRFLIPLTIIIGLGLLLWRGLYTDPSLVRSPLIGKSIPEFSLPSLMSSDQLRDQRVLTGKPKLLNIWASWCVACRVEHDVLLGLQESGVDIIGLNYKDTQVDALQWLKDRGNPYSDVLIDADGKIGIELGVYGVPETFLVDAEGIIRYKYVGPLTVDVVKRELAPIFRELSITPTNTRGGK